MTIKRQKNERSRNKLILDDHLALEGADSEIQDRINQLKNNKSLYPNLTKYKTNVVQPIDFKTQMLNMQTRVLFIGQKENIKTSQIILYGAQKGSLQLQVYGLTFNQS
jgi:hypothetical protein